MAKVEKKLTAGQILGGKLKELREKADKTQSEVAEMLDVTLRQYQRYESGVIPKPEKMSILKKEFKYDFFSHIDDENSTFGEDVTTYSRNRRPSEPNYGIPIFEAPIKAGLEPMYRDEFLHPDYYVQIPQFRDCTYGCRASGDSMYPEIRNGDIMICKEITDKKGLVFGDIYVIQTISGIETVKYLHPNKQNPEMLTLKARNEKVPDTDILKEEITRIYKVRGVFKGM